ncbi:MAG: cytochrome c3 family protein [Bdellovibrionota bacterium]
MGLTRLDFDHADTGWLLTGKHEDVKCESCHKKKRDSGHTSYLGLDTQCKSCHTDIHKSAKNDLKQCERCHSTSQWKPIRSTINFEHNQETKYPLTGSHRNVDCYGCHTKKTWAPYKFSQCTDCHRDPHRGQYGKNCTNCHNTGSWGKAKGSSGGGGNFNHDKTRFPLRGEHRAVSCQQCHGPVIGKMKNFEQCSGCHNNPHDQQFSNLWTPKQCTDCHQEQSWTPTKFKHNEDARYELRGKHEEVPCAQCHYNKVYRWLSGTPDCNTCHQDVHNAQFADRPCASCHNFDGFSALDFDHSKTRFPLVGKHQDVTCENCHQQGRYAGLGTECQTCHNDFHKGELGQACKRCHAPVAFNDIEFDHNRSAKFKIDGAHVQNQCNQCHWDYKYKFGKFNCSTCHQDVHNGSFGTACQRCHTTTEFERSEGYHDFGDFSIEGVHNKLECDQCHDPSQPTRTLNRQCTTCHRDPHMNSLSDRCSDCHRQTSWLPTTFRHNQTGFELSGAHRFLECGDCHYNRVFGGLPQEC